jgi:hypothetical protein
MFWQENPDTKPLFPSKTRQWSGWDWTGTSAVKKNRLHTLESCHGPSQSYFKNVCSVIKPIFRNTSKCPYSISCYLQSTATHSCSIPAHYFCYQSHIFCHHSVQTNCAPPTPSLVFTAHNSIWASGHRSGKFPLVGVSPYDETSAERV